jgi:hypothetical protein
MFAGLLVAAALAVSKGDAPPPAQDDEARIEELFSVEVGQQPTPEQAEEARVAAAEAQAAEVAAQFPPPSGAAVEFEDLGKLLGYPVRVRIGEHVRAGRIQKVAKDSVTLKAPMGGGYAEFTLNKRQISSIEMQ